MSGGFLGRWSQRKRDVQAGRLDVPVSDAPADVAQPVVLSDPEGLEAQGAQVPDAVPAQVELPTLADAEQLTLSSDFQPFMAKDVASEVRNAAMKKLFADPHFNVMDGLDIYIGDYNTPDPLPPEMLRQMVGAQFLGLWDDEVPAPTVSGQEMATQINPATAEPVAYPSEHDHTDLRLQPNPAAANPEPESGAG